MVLSILCKDNKIYEKNCMSYFGINVSQSIIHSIFSAKEPIGILGKLLSFSASYQLLLVLLNGHLVFCEDQKQTLEVPWGRIASIIWHYYVLNVLMSTE